MNERFLPLFLVGMGLALAGTVFIILAQVRGKTPADFPFFTSDPAVINREGRLWRALGYLATLGCLVCWVLAFATYRN